MYLNTDSYYTAGHAEIYAQGNDVRPQFREAIFDELRTYQAKQGIEVHTPLRRKWGNSVSFIYYAPNPPLKEMGLRGESSYQTHQGPARPKGIERYLPTQSSIAKLKVYAMYGIIAGIIIGFTIIAIKIYL